ncbi:zinc finger protein [Tirmania nivea]|nr:zinc finger protein [Tirmania nivea]
MASVTTDSASQNTQDREARPRGGGGVRGQHTEGRGVRRESRRRGIWPGERGRGRGRRDARPPVDPDPSDALQMPLKELNVSSSPKEGQTMDGDAEEPVCFICANPVVYHSIAPCGHSTCHICSLRMRALYGVKACAHCRTESENVVFAPDEEKKYDEYDDSSIVKTDAKLGIKYATVAIHDDTVLLLRYNCPEPNCDVACLGWRNLHGHVRSAHDRVLCRLCTRNKKVFTHEHALFTLQQLKKHERDGDDAPGSADQSGFKGHPECGFCRERFYSSDELYNHCREAHERCFICDRQNYSQNQQYYLNYDALVVHFQNQHFMCPEQDCLEKKFIVFESDVDLRAHQLEVHPHGLSKAAKKDARRIDIAQFELGRGRGRDRDLNAELPPARAEQPLRRDELAYQRILAVQSSQSTTSRTFGGQLTQVNGPAFAAQPTPTQASRPVPVQTAAIPAVRTPAAAAAPPVRPPVAATAAVAFPPLGATQFPPLNSSPAPPSQLRASPLPTQSSQTPQIRPSADVDNTKKLRHAAVIERASALLKGDPKKLDTFRRYVSEYRTDVQTAREACDSFWNLFDTNANYLGSLIRALADLYDDENKRTGLLTAWNSWKAMTEDCPPFTGSGSSTPSAGGARVLKIKSSTTPSARSARQGAWGTAASPLAAPAQPSTNHATSTSASSPLVSPAVNRSAQPVRTVVTSPVSMPYASPASSINNTKRAPSAAEFPSLPAKPPMHTFGPVIRNGVSGGRGAVNPWMAPQSNGAGSTEPGAESEAAGSGKKKKGKQKQTLFHFG